MKRRKNLSGTPTGQEPSKTGAEPDIETEETAGKVTNTEKLQEQERIRQGRSIRLKLTLFAFGIMMLSGMITVAVYYIIVKLLGELPLVIAITVNPVFAAIVLLGSCGIISTILFAWLSKYYLRPVKQLIRATEEVRNGNYEVRVEFEEKHPISEMQRLMSNFNSMTEELGGIELFRNNFINDFSHEFKTPIVSIRGFAKELQLEGLTEEQRHQYARIIEEESDRLVRLSTSVLELSKLEHQQIVSQQADFYLDEQIRQCILLFEKEWTEKEIEIQPLLEEVQVHFNEDMLSLVWKNLISNAIKFTPDGGKICVTMRVLPDRITVQVRDNGVGMTEEVRKRIFEKFFQGDPSRQKKGYGIGLAIVHRVVLLCKGTITVSGAPGEGSCFEVTLPRGEPD